MDYNFLQFANYCEDGIVGTVRLDYRCAYFFYFMSGFLFFSSMVLASPDKNTIQSINKQTLTPSLLKAPISSQEIYHLTCWGGDAIIFDQSLSSLPIQRSIAGLAWMEVVGMTGKIEYFSKGTPCKLRINE